MSFIGSKAQAGVFQRIIGQMPPHSLYVEAFFGSGQVFWRKARAQSSIVMDKDAAALAKVGAEAGVKTMNGDALKYLASLAPALPADAVVYCDPPYLLSTRQGRLYYGPNEMSDQEHASLLALLQVLPCRVLLSGYPSDLYSSQLYNWRCISYRTRTRGKTVTECLWCNFDEPTELHDWRYAGANFRQRLHFNRCADRWLDKLEKMAPRKRGFILDAISQRHFQRSLPEGIASPGAADRNAGNGNGAP